MKEEHEAAFPTFRLNAVARQIFMVQGQIFVKNYSICHFP
jgi:hypothetical protein